MHTPFFPRSGLILCLCLTSTILPMTKVQAREARRPNILFIAVDDLRPELGCYGSEIVRSPNIDHLAEQGVRFDNAYCQQAICGPSRASVMTGARPDTIGVVVNDANFRKLNPDIVTMSQHFIRHGYQAVNCGKVFHGNTNDPEHSWTRILADGDYGLHQAQLTGGYHEPENQERYRNNREEMIRQYGDRASEYGIIHGPAVESAEVDDEVYTDGFNTRLALKALEEFAENPDQPWFLGMGYYKPHLNFIAPARYWDLYNRNEIPLTLEKEPPEGYATMGLHPGFELRVRDGIPKTGPIPPDLAKELIHGYLACASYIDAQIGLLVGKLEDLDQSDNTIVVLWGDHGWHLGEMGTWGKATNYEISTRVPLIVSAPGIPNKSRGRASVSIVELLDLYPTLCELAGLPSPPHLQGSSLVPLLNNPDLIVESPAFSQFPSPALREWAARPLSKGMRQTFFGPMIEEVEGRIQQQFRKQWDRMLFEDHLMGYAMRTRDHRMVAWKDVRDLGASPLYIELYDLSIDPQERVNIADEAPLLVDELLKQLNKEVCSSSRWVPRSTTAVPSGSGK